MKISEKQPLRCAYCGVPFPDSETPYRPIQKGKDEKNLDLFCCIGCLKGYERVDNCCREMGLDLHEALSSQRPELESAKASGSDWPLLVLELASKAMALGASRAAPILAKEVVVDIRVQNKCKVPFCRHLGTNLCCPPFSPSVSEIEKLRNAYEYAIVIQCQGNPEKFLYPSTQCGLQTVYYMRLNNIVSRIEALAQRKGYYLATAFGAGHCKLCGYGIDPKIKCAGVIDGVPNFDKCRYPLRARPAAESVGIDIFKTARKLGFDSNFIGITSPIREIECASTFGVVFLD